MLASWGPKINMTSPLLALSGDKTQSFQYNVIRTVVEMYIQIYGNINEDLLTQLGERLSGKTS